jgi:hypothetical protein
LASALPALADMKKSHKKEVLARSRHVILQQYGIVPYVPKRLLYELL